MSELKFSIYMHDQNTEKKYVRDLPFVKSRDELDTIHEELYDDLVSDLEQKYGVFDGEGEGDDDHYSIGYTSYEIAQDEKTHKAKDQIFNKIIDEIAAYVKNNIERYRKLCEDI